MREIKCLDEKPKIKKYICWTFCIILLARFCELQTIKVSIVITISC